MIKIAILGLGAALVVPAAESIPRYDIQAFCRAQTSARDGDGESLANCVKDEAAARQQLATAWRNAAPRSRDVCAGEQQGVHSYVDLAACLDMYASQ